MANTFTEITPTLHRAMDVISQEQNGATMAVMRDTSADVAALNQNVTISVTQDATINTITPSMTIPQGDDQTVNGVSVVMDTMEAAQIPWTAQDRVLLQNGDLPQLREVMSKQVMQAVRALRNKVEDKITDQYIYASRAYGTAGTAPFATADDLSDFANIARILDDNGAPDDGDRHLVLGSAAYASLMGKQSSLFKINEAGTDDLLRRGSLGQVEGLQIHKSAKIETHTAGTGASATTDNAGYAIGATTLTLASAGTGTIIAGDSITLAGDTNKYMVVTGDTDVSDGGTIVLAAPGLRQAIPAAATAITVVESAGGVYAGNMAFSRNAIVLATRLPSAPSMQGQGTSDAAMFEEVLTDEYSGISMRYALYGGYHKTMTEVSLLYGVKTIKPEHFALLLG